MTKKQVKIVVCILQAVLIGILFLPSANSGGSGGAALNTFGLVKRYSDIGHNIDALAYIMLAICSPVITALSAVQLRERRNFGVGVCLSGLTSIVHAIFYTVVKTSMSGSVTVNGLHYLIILIALINLFIEIYGFILANPEEKKKKKERPH